MDVSVDNPVNDGRWGDVEFGRVDAVINEHLLEHRDQQCGKRIDGHVIKAAFGSSVVCGDLADLLDIRVSVAVEIDDDYEVDAHGQPFDEELAGLVSCECRVRVTVCVQERIAFKILERNHRSAGRQVQRKCLPGVFAVVGV